MRVAVRVRLLLLLLLLFWLLLDEEEEGRTEERSGRLKKVRRGVRMLVLVVAVVGCGIVGVLLVGVVHGR